MPAQITGYITRAGSVAALILAMERAEVVDKDGLLTCAHSWRPVIGEGFKCTNCGMIIQHNSY